MKEVRPQNLNLMTKLKILLPILALALFLDIISMPDILYGAESTVCHSQSGGHCINFAATAYPGLEFLGDATGLGDLLSRLFTFGMRFVGIAAFIMFIIGGVQYMVAGDKDPTEAKNRMKNAAIGLGIALISWLILFTINPDLVKKLNLTNLRKLEYTPPQLSPETQRAVEKIGGQKVIETDTASNLHLAKEVILDPVTMTREQIKSIEENFARECEASAQGRVWRVTPKPLPGKGLQSPERVLVCTTR